MKQAHGASPERDWGLHGSFCLAVASSLVFHTEFRGTRLGALERGQSLTDRGEAPQGPGSQQLHAPAPLHSASGTGQLRLPGKATRVPVCWVLRTQRVALAVFRHFGGLCQERKQRVLLEADKNASSFSSLKRFPTLFLITDGLILA